MQGAAREGGKFGFAVVVALSSTATMLVIIRHLLSPWLEQPAALSLVVLAVVVSSAIAGFVSGLVATIAGTLGAVYWLLEPVGWAVGSPGDRVRLVVLACIGLSVSFASDRLRSTKRELARTVADLEHERRALRASDDRLQLFIDQAPASIAMFDRDMRYLSASTRWCSDYGLRQCDLVGYCHYERFPDIPERWKEVHRRTLAGESLSAEEDRFERANGTTTWRRWMTRPWYDAAGKIGGILIFSEDITARKNAEIALQELQEKNAESLGLLETLLAHAPAGIALLSPELRFVHVNEALATMDGFSVAEHLGKTVREVIPELWPILEPVFARALAGETVRDIDLAGTTRAQPGEQRHWQASYYPVRGDDGHFIGVGVIVREVTEAKRLEEALRDRERLLHLATSHARAGLVVLDADHRYLLVNEAYGDMVGLPPAKLIGKRVIDVLPATWPTIQPKLDRALAGERLEYETTLEDQYGPGKPERSIAVYYEPSTNARGQRNVVAVVIDITERKRAENALRESDRRKDEFLAMLAHELRNPLSPIKYAAELLRRAPLGEARRAHWIDIIDRQVDHLSRMVDDLLDVSRVSRGRISLQMETIDLSAVASQAVEINRPLIEARKHRLELTVPREPVFVRGDRVRLVQVLANLLNNAGKYTDPGGLIQVRVENVAINGYGGAVLRVRDTGRGIEPKDVPHLFDMFYQVERSLDRSEGGLGIGLSLVRHLVTLHGGTVEAESEGTGQGSEFIVRLPLDATTMTVSHTEALPQALGKQRALVVDDNVDAADTMAVLLESLGHDVRVVHDGTAALKEAEELRPDIVLLDIGLPGIDGYDVCRELRRRTGNAMRIVAVTGYGQASDRRRAVEAGFDDYLVKPVAVEQIRASLDTPSGGRVSP